MILQAFKNDKCDTTETNNCHYYSERTKKKLRRDEACVQATMCQKQSKEMTLPPSSMLGEPTCNKMLEEGA